jgi:hypothetical protein
MSQGKWSSFKGWPRELFAEEARKSDLGAANSGSPSKRRRLPSSGKTASRSSCHSTRHGSLAFSIARSSRCQSAAESDSGKTSNTAVKSSSITSSGAWSASMRARSYSIKARLFALGAALHLDQGIAVTSHASQAKTVDQVIASVPVGSFSQTNEAQLYVSMSRAKWAMPVFTDSKVAPRDAATRPSKRLSSSELLDLAKQNRTLKAELARRGTEPKKQEQEVAYVR